MNLDENAPMLAQEVKTNYRNVQSGQILLKTLQCEHKNLKTFKETRKVDEFQ